MLFLRLIIHFLDYRTLLFSIRNRAFLIFILASFFLFAGGQESTVIPVRITQWYGNKPGAVSVTFDDNDYSQYVSAYPVLEKYGIKGTFSVVGEWVAEEPANFAEAGFFEIKRMGWPQLLELYEHGHELAAHGYHHQKYDKFKPAGDLAVEMKEIKTLIESKIPGQVCTLHYPYSFASENIPGAAKEAGYLFGRTGLDTINPPVPPDMLLLASQAVINAELPDTALFRQWIMQARGNWLILMYHHFFQAGSKEISLLKSHDVEYTYSILPEEFEQQVACLATSGYWIAPLCEIGKYITERENTEIRAIRAKKKIIINMVTNLDKPVYDIPLTLEASIPWKKVRIEGSLNDGVFQVNDNTLFIDAMPENELIITKE